MSPPVVWSFEPSVIIGVLAISAIYLWAWRRARQPGQPHPPGYGRLALFVCGMLVVVAALISPIDALSEDLMVIHMVQHMLLLDAMPILLVLSLTKGLLRPVTRRISVIERRAGFFGSPWFAVIAYVGLLWMWHEPTMYDLAAQHSGIHALEHLCFSCSGFLYWWHLISPIRSRRHLRGMEPVFYMSITKVLVGALGIGLTFMTTCIYPYYAALPHYWGLSPRVDQNLAGAFMALEQSVVMGVALGWILINIFTESEREAKRRDRYEIAS